MIQLRSVTKKYKNNYALKNINLDIMSGEFVFVTGASGAGKSTLMKLLYKEETPTSGTVLIGGINIANLPSDKVPNLRRCMGIVFQDYKLLPNISVYDNVAYVIRTLGMSTKEIRTRVIGALKVVGLLDKRNSKPTELSGGEQQRVSIARAIVNGPPLLIADEPTGKLDPKNSLEIMQILDQINQRGITIIVSTHDKSMVNYFRKRVIKLDNGEIVNGANQENAAYPSGLCAERTAIFYANAQYPKVPVEAIAVACYTNGHFTERAGSPCGNCRQVLLETEQRFKRNMAVLLYGEKEILWFESAKSLLPHSFVDDDLNG